MNASCMRCARLSASASPMRSLPGKSGMRAMAERRQIRKAGHGEGETHPPPVTDEQFRESSEFRRFKGIMKRLLKVPKQELDKRVEQAKAASPRLGNPNAPGRK